MHCFHLVAFFFFNNKFNLFIYNLYSFYFTDRCHLSGYSFCIWLICYCFLLLILSLPLCGYYFSIFLFLHLFLQQSRFCLGSKSFHHDNVSRITDCYFSLFPPNLYIYSFFFSGKCNLFGNSFSYFICHFFVFFFLLALMSDSKLI